MRTRISRRSVSSCDSPGPRRPIPPFCCSRLPVKPRIRRVDKCLSCASSTCSFPSWVRARKAKISRIKPVRSITRHFSTFSRLRSWAGESEWSKITSSASRSLTCSAISSTLPEPIKNFGSGLLRCTEICSRISAPAD